MTNNKPFTSTFLTCHARAHSLASPTWSQLVRFILLVWLGWLPGLYMNICCTYFICSLCMDYSNQIKSNRNDCKSTPYYILELRTFPFWLLLRLLLLLFPCFSLSHLGCWCFFCVSCRNNNTINGKKQNMVEHLNKTTTKRKKWMIIAWQITCKRYICTAVDSSFYACQMTKPISFLFCFIC